MESESQIERNFLQSFIIKLVREMKIKNNDKIEQKTIIDETIPAITEQLRKNNDKMQATIMLNRGKLPKPQSFSFPEAHQITNRKLEPQPRYLQNKNIQIKKPYNNQGQSQKKPSIPQPSGSEKISILGLKKIESLISDNAVQTIECPGPGRQILVYKSGVIQTTPITLDAEEINNIMKEISEKTRIPVTSGIFKAAFDNIITTAVVSEFVGTRFIIQKKNIVQQQNIPQNI